MTETQLRFLRAIGERLPLANVAELYLFPPMRQGNTESGIAVIAAVIARATTPELESSAERDAATAAELSAAGMATAGDGDESPMAPLADATGALACDPTEDASRDDGSESDIPGEGSSPVDGANDDDDVGAAAGATVADANVDDMDGDEQPSAPAVAPVGAPTRERHTVYTARYRLTLKGPERGKWELNVVDEADAPLLTVEMVVRGVQQRSGEGAEPERLEPAALRELLETAAPSGAAPR